MGIYTIYRNARRLTLSLTCVLLTCLFVVPSAADDGHRIYILSSKEDRVTRIKWFLDSLQGHEGDVKIRMLKTTDFRESDVRIRLDKFKPDIIVAFGHDPTRFAVQANLGKHFPLILSGCINEQADVKIEEDIDDLKAFFEIGGFYPDKWYFLMQRSYMNHHHIHMMTGVPVAQRVILEIENIVALRNELAKINAHGTGVIIVTPMRIRNERGSFLSSRDVYQEIVRWNKRHLEVGLSENSAEFLSMAFIPSPSRIGVLTGKRVLDALHKKDTQQERIKSKVTINYDRLRRLGMPQLQHGTDMIDFVR